MLTSGATVTTGGNANKWYNGSGEGNGNKVCNGREGTMIAMIVKGKESKGSKGVRTTRMVKGAIVTIITMKQAQGKTLRLFR